MTPDTPRGPDGAKLCAWCGGPIKQSGVGRSRDYCSRTHREYAYRARRQEEVRLVAYSRGRADERTISSTVESRRDPIPSVDEMKPPGPAPVPASAAPSVPQEPPAVEPPPLPPAPRRRLSRNRSAMQAEAMPLWAPDEFRPGPSAANGE